MGYSVPVIHSLGIRLACSPPHPSIWPQETENARVTASRSRHACVTPQVPPYNPAPSPPSAQNAHAQHELAALGLRCRGAGPSVPGQPERRRPTHPSTFPDGSPAGPCSLAGWPRAPRTLHPCRHLGLTRRSSSAWSRRPRNVSLEGRGAREGPGAEMQHAHAQGKGRCAHLC